MNRRCPLTSCYRMVWQEGGMCFPRHRRGRDGQMHRQKKHPGLLLHFSWPARGFIIFLCLKKKQLPSAAKWHFFTIFLAKLFQALLLKWVLPKQNEITGGGNKVVTSGIKAQASVFNVRGRPCLCVEASGSMKGGRRGHFRHLLLPCTTHLSICVHCCPSVHSHTHTQVQRHTPSHCV